MSESIDEDARPSSESVEGARERDHNGRVRKPKRPVIPTHHDPEARRMWVAANRERVREKNRRWRAEHLDRARQLNRASMRRVTARRRRQAEQRDRGRERAKRWREMHPERVRESHGRWVEENRTKVREYQRRYYEKHRDEVNARAAARRDADPDRVRRVSEAWSQRNTESRAESQRNRRSDPATYQALLAANAAAKRLARRLGNAGLPPKRLHKTNAAERRANEREADAYFADPSLPEHLRQVTVFGESLRGMMQKNGVRLQEFAEAYAATRARIGLPAVVAEDIKYARAVDVVMEQMRRVDLLTSRDVAAAVRSTKAAFRQDERKQQFDRLVKEVVVHVQRNFARLTEEANMENLARSQRGRPRISIESFVVRLATQEVVHRELPSQLTLSDVSAAVRFAEARVVLPSEGNGGVTPRSFGIPPIR